MVKRPVTPIAGRETLRAVLVALIASIPPTILAVAVLMTSLNTSDKADVIITKADEIHTLTNSRMTEVATDLKIALSRVESLEQMIKLMGNDTLKYSEFPTSK